jgi:hypothetical protein
VHLVEVDPVGAEPGERGVARLAHDIWVRTLHRTELGGDDDIVAARAQRATEELLAQRAAVDVGRVEERDPRVEGSVHHRGAALLVDAHAEVVAAEPHERDVQRAELPSLHGVSVAQATDRVRAVHQVAALTSRSTRSSGAFRNGECPVSHSTTSVARAAIRRWCSGGMAASSAHTT